MRHILSSFYILDALSLQYMSVYYPDSLALIGHIFITATVLLVP